MQSSSQRPRPGQGARSGLVERLRAVARFDLSPPQRPPTPVRFILATVVAVAVSLGADEGLVDLATSVYPSIADFAHFRFSDYATLTVVGVLGACAGWPVVARVSAAPRWLFLRLAVLVTLVLWLPDLWILVRGEPVRAVLTLMVMHLAIALVTYNSLVRIAPVRRRETDEEALARQIDDIGAAMDQPHLRRAWDAMAVLVGIEFALGVATIMVVHLGRSATLFPHTGTAVYIAHAGLGLVLGIGALTLLVLPPPGRMARTGAALGAIGIGLAGAGGILAVFHPSRMAGMALMLLGTVVAVFGYLMPALEAFGEAERRRAGVPPTRSGPTEG